jgi:hypothetical protein
MPCDRQDLARILFVVVSMVVCLRAMAGHAAEQSEPTADEELARQPVDLSVESFRPRTSELLGGWMVRGRLGAHLPLTGDAPGVSVMVDGGYVWSFGLGVVAHLDYSTLFPPEDDYSALEDAYFVNLSVGPQFVLPLGQGFRAWAQGTYGLSVYNVEGKVEIEDYGEMHSSSALLAHGLCFAVGGELLLAALSGTSQLWLGGSAGIDLNLAEGLDDATHLQHVLKVAVSLGATF